MKVAYREAARDDVIRQVRFYLVELDRPDVALRYKQSVRITLESIQTRPLMAPRCLLDNPLLADLRSWPVRGFPSIRVYYLVQAQTIQVLRVLHGKRDIRRILGQIKL